MIPVRRVSESCSRMHLSAQLFMILVYPHPLFQPDKYYIVSSKWRVARNTETMPPQQKSESP